MAKIAIVSTYGEDCGIAFYAERLKKNFEYYTKHQISMIPLNLLLLKSHNHYFLPAANRYLDKLARSFSEYDALILQFEPGIFANSLHQAQKRVIQLIKAHPNVLLTLHCPSYLNNTLSIKRCLKELISGHFRIALKTLHSMRTERLWHRFWLNMAKFPQVKIHTHSQHDKNILETLYQLPQIFDFPHALFRQEEIAEYRSQYQRDSFLERYKLDPRKQYIAIFGFYGAYKGHLTALKMLAYLPEDYQLLIIGSDHPQAKQTGSQVGGYLSEMLSLLESPKKNATGKSLVSRVRFLGHIRNQDVPEFYSGIDYVVLPYFNPESGQSGSGPAAHALEFHCRALFSNATVFRLLECYFKDAMKLCTVGNYIEFSQNILSYERYEEALQEALQNALAYYNPETFIEKYEEALGFRNQKKMASRTAYLESET